MKVKDTLRKGLFATSATLFTMALLLPMIANNYRGEINDFLGTSNEEILPVGELTTEEKEGLYRYRSTYSNTTELVQALADVGQRMSEEGTVLLKNENNALPLDESHRKVTLLGTAAYNPHQGGEMGSGFQKNSGTDADTVALINGFKKSGLEYSTVVQQAYRKAKAAAQKTTSVTGDEPFENNEVSLSALDAADPNWQSEFSQYDTAIIVLGRASSEQATYMPGESNVSEKDRALHQTDALGLNDDERALIDLAVQKKKEGVFNSVIVLVNAACTMELKEIQDNTGVDAILQIGFPGGYGFYGIARILKGEVSPSGRLPDTYATDNASSPAAQNYGVFQWSNLGEIESSPDYQGRLINNYLVESEGIYRGYRYYETRYYDQVQGLHNATSSVGSTSGAWNYANEVVYPFGYGLSYTTFTQTLDSLEVDKDARKVTATITVTNTGDREGKEVVQLYANAPYIEGGIEKSAIRLIDYGKTDTLAANGGKETVTLEADLQDVASWDSQFAGGSYVLDEGNYYFAIGNGAHEALNNVLHENGKTGLVGTYQENTVAVWNNPEKDGQTLKTSDNGTEVSNHLEDMDLNYWEKDSVTYLSRQDWAGTFPTPYEDLEANEKMLPVLANDLHPVEADEAPKVTFGANNHYTLADLAGVYDINDERWEKLMDQITLEECMERIPFGGKSCKPITSINSPEAIQYDGPNGYNNAELGNKVESMTWMKDIDPCYFTAEDSNAKFKGGVMGNETLIASTFSKQMAREYGEITGNYSLWAHVTILWGAGLNLHRLPYNARNHEYYSEDPVLSGYQGANFIAGGNEFGAIISPKHFAFNDTEIQRFGIAPFMTEQTARELELRSFQMAVEVGDCRGMMTSLSRCGVTALNSHEGLMLDILREEWGFKGLMSTDAATNKYYFSVKELAHCGVTMTTMTNGDITGGWEYWTVENVSKDNSLQADVKKAMLYQNWAIANSNAMNGWSNDYIRIPKMTWYDGVIIGIEVAMGALTVGALLFFIWPFIRKGKEA